jgi:c-di-GMP-binding flagellar brake protein YcgR
MLERKYKRLSLPNNAEILVECEVEGKLFKTRLSDLSLNGLCIKFPDEVCNSVNPGTLLPLWIHFSDGFALKALITIKHIKGVYLGGQYAGMCNLVRHQLDSFVWKMALNSEGKN